MQTIRTRYHGPSNVKGSRISARCEAGSIMVEYDHSLDLQDNHRAACRSLLMRLEWVGGNYQPMAGGCFNGDFYWSFVEPGSLTEPLKVAK